MKMIKKNKQIIFLFFILMSLIIQISCNFSGKKTENGDNIKDKNSDCGYLINYLIDSILTDSPDYSICGNICTDIPDSTFSIILDKFPDYIIKEEDKDVMLKQYIISEGQKLHEYIDTSKFKVITHLDSYSDKSFYNIHYSFSIPIFTKDKSKSIIYLIAFLPNKGESDIFLVFEKKGTNWIKTSQVLNKIEIPIEEYHYHDYSLVPLHIGICDHKEKE